MYVCVCVCIYVCVCLGVCRVWCAYCGVVACTVSGLHTKVSNFIRCVEYVETTGVVMI